MAEEPMEVSAAEPPADQSTASAPEAGGGAEGSAEPPTTDETKETPSTTDESGKKVYTEEERLKRKAYFKRLRDNKRLAREKYQRRNLTRTVVNPKSRVQSIPDVVISFDMTQEEDKLLEFYKVKMSALKSTNEQLHKRLAFLVKENIRLLQMGPPLKKL